MECERAEQKNGVGGDRFFWSLRVFNAGSIEKEDRPLQRSGGAFRKYLFSSWHVGPHLVSMKGIHFAVQDN